MRRFAVSLLLASAVLGAPSASAQPTGTSSSRDLAAAEVLFQEAQKLYADGDFDTACEKFSASYDLDPGLGTLLNLARCYEKAGRTASAWAAYVDLSALASRAGQRDRATIADERIAALEPDLMRLRLVVPAGADVEVSLDDEPVANELFGSALPVDPGEHRVSARRPGGEPYATHPISVSEPGKTVELTIEAPPDAPGPVAPEPEAPPPAPETQPPPAPPPEPPPAINHDDRTAWWVAGGITGGLGLVALGVSAGFTADAASAWSDAGCRGGLCPDASSQALSEQAGRSADIATGVGIGGGLLAATGTVLILVGALAGEDDPVIGATPHGLCLAF